MKRIAYYIGITGLFIAFIILQLLFFDYSISVIIIYVVFLLLFDVVRLYVKEGYSDYKTFKEFNQIKLKQIKSKYQEPKLLTQHTIYHLYVLIDMLFADFESIKSRYNEFTYFTDLEQYATSYLFEYYYLLTNDVNAFIKFRESFNQMHQRVQEDKIITKKPGVIHYERRTLIIDLSVLELIFGLYKHNYSVAYVEEYNFQDPVYNFIKEKALFNYYKNTEQNEKAKTFWENSVFLYDHITQEELHISERGYPYEK